MRNLWKFVRASLKMTYREKIAMFWLFMFPLLLILLFGAIFGSSGQTNISIGIVNLDNSRVTREIVKRLEGVTAFKIKRGNERQLSRNLADNKLDAVLVLEKGFESSMLAHQPGAATISTNRTNPTVSQIASAALKQIIGEISVGMAKQFTPNVIGPGDIVEIAEKSVTSHKLRYIDYMVPGILAMTLMTSGMLGLSLSFVQNREKGVLRRIKASPLPLSRYIGSEIIAAFMLSLMQAIVMLLVGWVVFKMRIHGNWLYMAFIVMLGAFSFLAAGFFIASVTKTLKTAEMASNAIVFPMMFLSGVYFPLAILPGFLVVIAKCMPLYYLADALRKVMVQNKGLADVWLNILIVGGMGVICFVASIKFFRWE